MQEQKESLFDTVAGIFFGVICGGGYLLSAPLGIYYAFVNGSLFNGVFSFFIPFWGIGYSIFIWLK